MKKKLFVLTLTLLLAVFGVACSNETTNKISENASNNKNSGETVVIKLGHQIATDSTLHAGAEKFKELVEEKSNGSMKVEIFPSAQLGDARSQVESNINGTIQISMGSTPLLASFAPKATVLSLPYILEGSNERERFDSFKKLTQSDVFQEITQQASDSGLKIVPESIWWYGDRHITSNRPLSTPKDLQGLKIRTPDDARVHTVPFEVMGTNVTPMSFAEVYTGLQTKLIDAQENPVNVIYTSKFYEVQDYINLTGHMTQVQVPIISKVWWDSLTEEQQLVVTEAIIEAGDYSSELTIKANEEQLSDLEANGMTIIEVDQTLFKEATKDVYKEFDGAFTDAFFNKILDAQK